MSVIEKEKMQIDVYNGIFCPQHHQYAFYIIVSLEKQMKRTIYISNSYKKYNNI